MTERPILFSGAMVRALLSGTKTQTRRVIGARDTDALDAAFFCEAFAQLNSDPARFLGLRCPYGAPGDRLWVRETWKVSSESNHYPTDEKRLYVEYRAGAVAGTGQQQSKFSIQRDGELAWAAWGKGKVSSCRPSIHMPRWASRLTLEVTGVRVERLQDITEEDARAEGARRFDDLPSTHPYGQDARWSCVEPKSTEECLGSARMAFANLWNSINGADSWAANPWVWRIEFRRVTP